MTTFAIAVLFMFAQRPDLLPSPPMPVLIVNGNAQISAVPDEAAVRLGIVRQSSNAQAAQEQANAVAQEILSAIGKVGVPANQIQTARLILSPVYCASWSGSARCSADRGLHCFEYNFREARESHNRWSSY